MALHQRWVLAAGLLLLLATALSFFDVYFEPNTCSMSYSRPHFYNVDVKSPSSKVSNRYHTYLFREGGISQHFEGPHTLGGTPVLFIPGNAGSYSQGRSLAALAANMGHEMESKTIFDFFLIHFSEDMSALHGKTIVDEAEYVNDAIHHILDLYKDHDELEVLPTSVIILCHSMGGIVARTVVTLDNYTPGSVNTIVTLGTPHLVPPLTLDKDVTLVYDRVNQYWRNCYAKEHSPLENTTLVSVSGGHIDHMVLPGSTPVDSLIPPSHGISAYSYSIPNVWRGIDHLAIMWCAELRHVVVDSLFKIADPWLPERTLPVKDRMEVLQASYRSPIDSLRPNDTLIWHEDAGENLPGLFKTPIGHFEIADSTSYPQSGLMIPVEYVSQLSSLFWLGLTGVNVPLFGRFTDIRLPAVHSSLISLKVDVSPECAPTAPAKRDLPVTIRAWTPRESRWYPGSSARIVWYSDSPYMPFDDSRGLHVQVFAPKICQTGPNYIAHIRVDWWATLANLTMNYRASLATYPLAIVIICVLIQLAAFYNHKNISFADSLDVFTQHHMVNLAKGLAFLHLLLCWKPLRNLVRDLQIPSERYNIHALQRQTFDIHDLLVGVDEPLLCWIAPALLFMATAILIIVHRILSMIVVANEWMQLYLCRGSRGPGVPEAWKHEPLVYIGGNVLWILALFFIPYQIVFIAMTVFLITKTTDTNSWQYTFSMLLLWTSVIDGPIVAVWVHNINVEWSLAFSTYRNIVAAAPIVVLVYFLSQHPSPIPPPCQNTLFRRFTYASLLFMAWYSLVYGAMHTFMMHHLVNYFAGWLLVLYLERPRGKKSQ